MWELRQSLGFTDPLGPERPRRTGQRAQLHHGDRPSTRTALLPLPDAGAVRLLPAAAQSQSAQLDHARVAHALTGWVKDGTEPPPSSAADASPPAIWSRRTRCSSRRIPANNYGDVARPAVRFIGEQQSAACAGLRQRLRRRRRHPASSAGDPPKLSAARYGNLVAQVDADGNDLGGIRNVFVEAPIGTYTGWNLLPQGLLRGRILHAARQLHSVRPHQTGAPGRPAIRGLRSRNAIRPRRLMSRPSRRPPTISSRSASCCADDAARLVSRGGA